MFVANIKECWKWISTWLTALAASAPIAYDQLAFLQDKIPAPLFLKIQSALVLAIFAGRIIQQSPSAPAAADSSKPPAPG